MYNLDFGSIKRNPLTGLPNFFALLDVDSNEIYGDIGIVFIIDIVRFSDFNLKYGRNSGDRCLKTVALILDTEIEKFDNASLFNTAGDEFTIIFPSGNENDTKELISNMEEKCKDEIQRLGFGILEFHTLSIVYNKRIKSTSDLYKLKFKNRDDEDVKFNSETILNDIIWRYEKNIQYTLSCLESASHLALRDDISGLENNRSAIKYLYEELNKGLIKNNFAILFIDGDNLKRYNQISYQAGNQMIKDLSTVIKETLRKEDRVFRWLSGDEFLVVLNGVDNESVTKMSERIRGKVELSSMDWHFPITISIGVSVCISCNEDIDALLLNAELANNVAKQTGKNKVVLWNKNLTRN